MKTLHTQIILLGMLIIAAISIPLHSETIQYEYDSMDRVSQVHYEDGTLIAYTYDLMGNRTSKIITSGSSSNHPPYIPTNPSIPDGSENVALSPMLSWVGGDPDIGDTTTYIVYFGFPDNLKLIGNTNNAAYTPDPLLPFTRYCWQIVSQDTSLASTEGPIWCFRTVQDIPPTTPTPETPPGIPEPTTILLVGGGLLGIFVLVKKYLK